MHPGTFPLTLWEKSLYKTAMDENIQRTQASTGGRGTLLRPTPNWPADTSQALIRLWNAGLSAARIAARLGATTRAVECKVRKLRLAEDPLAAYR